MRPGAAGDEKVQGHAGELFDVTLELAGQPGFQDGELCPHEGSRHDGDGDARLLVNGVEPVTEVLLCVEYDGANTGLTGELDQAALYSVLNRILAFGLELVALSRLDDEPERRADTLARSKCT